MKRYDNGEVVTKSRIEDEEWYSSLHQPFLELAMAFHYVNNGNKEMKSDVDALYEYVLKGFKETFQEKLHITDEERVLRWSVLSIERMKDLDCHALERKMKAKSPKSVYLFSNGNVSCFDDKGEQMGELQSKAWIQLWLEWMESQGVNLLAIGEIRTIVNGRDVLIKPFKREDGWSWEIDSIIK